MRILLAIALLTSCSAEPEIVTLNITGGHETDVFQQAPAVTRLDVEVRAPGGAVLARARTTPGATFELGEWPLQQLIQIDLRGYDTNGEEQVAGRSMAAVPARLRSHELQVFAQRIGRWSRPPGQLSQTRVAGVAGVVGERFAFLTGGTGKAASGASPGGTLVFYDLLELSGANDRALPRAPRSVVVSADGRAVLLVDDEQAHWLDFDTGKTTLVTPPDGLSSFARVAGGRSVVGTAAHYLVGATRTNESTDAILVVGPDRELSSAKLTVARKGAAVAFVPNIGLVLVGGHENAPGVEVLPVGKSQAGARDFAADSTEGAGAVAGFSADLLLVAGGESGAHAAPVRLIDLACAVACSAAILPLDLATTLVDAWAFQAGDGRLLLVGQSALSGATESYALTLTPPQIERLPLREPRIGAAVLAAPNGSLLLLGGEDFDGRPVLIIESLIP